MLSARLLPATNRFPSAIDSAGFKPLADAVHALGLKFGIHIMRGIPRNSVAANLPIEGSNFTAAEAGNTNSKCVWCPDMFGVYSNAAGQAWYDSCARLWAGWGVDYIKVDDLSEPYRLAEVEMVRRAIDRCGRSIVFSTSPGEMPIGQAANVMTNANLWRVSGDFWDNWKSLDHEFALGARWHDFVGPGHWPDADMLPVGHLSVGNRSVGPDRFTHLTRDEPGHAVLLQRLGQPRLLRVVRIARRDGVERLHDLPLAAFDDVGALEEFAVLPVEARLLERSAQAQQVAGDVARAGRA